MNDRIKNLKKYTTIDKLHRGLRRSAAEAGIAELPEDFRAAGMPFQERAGNMLSAFLDAEKPVFLPGEKIVFTRTIKDIPDYVTPSEWEEIKKAHFVHEKGEVFNISADYEGILQKGLETRRAEFERLAESSGGEKKIFAESVEKVLAALQRLIGRYADEAERLGLSEEAAALRAVRNDPPKTFRQALQLLRAVHFAIWASGSYHNTLGRIDQYLYPFYKSDIESGGLDRGGAFELLEEFFLACNRDSDLYVGMQQGDNGQSVVLGGRNPEGKSMYNELSEMALKASYELALIDPKINMRVDANTPLEIFEMGSRLTKIGLGFPQYSNDDVVIPSLVEKGYDPADACEYVVAACWEFIIPKCALDVPNIDAMSLADCVNECVADLETCEKFDDFYALVEREIRKRAAAMGERHKNIFMKPSPIMSAFSQGALESGRDISFGLKYNNYGVHGTGIATAVDSLAAIKKHCFDEKSVGKRELIDALKSDFEGNENLLKKLRQQAPKMGTDDDFADELAVRLLDSFAGAFKDMRNDRGGRYRVGTGSAMFYIAHGRGLGATADGRRKDEVLPANYSPSLFIKQKGPISVVKSFAKPHLKNVANGGPLTLEFDSSVFRNDESVRKLAMLVRTFIALGGHQLQLNTVDRDKLLDAKAHPEKYPHLIVRVWGWSGYFVELDECYQDHVIRRIEFAL